jgi:hypothetical protein
MFPGRIPITGNRHTFIHEHGLAALAQLAVRHCRLDVLTPTLSLPDFGHVARLLLILNAHLESGQVLSSPPTVGDRRRFAVNVLYRNQFNQVDGGVSAQLARACMRQILLKYLPKYLPNLLDEFTTLTGLTIAQYLRVAAFMLA